MRLVHELVNELAGGEWGRSVAESGAGGGGRIMGAEAGVHHKLAEVWGFAESDRGRFDEEVLGGWIRGEDVEAFSKDPFESVEARIISSD